MKVNDVIVYYSNILPWDKIEYIEGVIEEMELNPISVKACAIRGEMISWFKLDCLKGYYNSKNSIVAWIAYGFKSGWEEAIKLGKEKDD